VNDEKLFNHSQRKFDEFHQLIEHSFVPKITQIVIQHSVIMREYLNEIEQVIANFGQILA